MHYVDAKFVPRLLTDEQKAKHSQSGAVWSFKCWRKLSLKCHNWWWNVSEQVRYRNKGAILAVGGKIVAMTKESTSESIKCLCCWSGFLFYFIYLLEVFHSSWVYSKWSDSQWTVWADRAARSFSSRHPWRHSHCPRWSGSPLRPRGCNTTTTNGRGEDTWDNSEYIPTTDTTPNPYSIRRPDVNKSKIQYTIMAH
jgi:hypothetical protein